MSVRRFLSGSFSAARLLANTVGKSLSASVSASSLKAAESVSYLQATASAIALRAKIEAAFFVRFFLLSDSGSVSDDPTLDITKPQTDAAGATDSHIFTYTKVAGDTELQTYCDITYFEEDYVEGPQVDLIEITDVLSLLITYGRNLTESPALTDSQAFDISMSFSDQAFVTDDLDGEATAEDDQEIQFVKVRSDGGVLTDSFAKTVTFARSFTETPAANDDPSFNVTKPLTEGPSASDSFSKVLAFSRSFTESPSVADSDTLNTGKNLSDNGGIIDSQVVQFTKVSSDSGVAADSGSLRSQGYCDFTYFAEDYVGASRTFT